VQLHGDPSPDIEGILVSATMKWGLSVLDWRSHAIDECGDHPLGVLKAECGHLLMMVTTLHDRPSGALCQECAERQFARAMTRCHDVEASPADGENRPTGHKPTPT
jgi:hypothetical protein